jgi:hypothetical protein
VVVHTDEVFQIVRQERDDPGGAWRALETATLGGRVFGWEADDGAGNASQFRVSDGMLQFEGWAGGESRSLMVGLDGVEFQSSRELSDGAYPGARDIAGLKVSVDDGLVASHSASDGEARLALRREDGLEASWMDADGGFGALRVAPPGSVELDAGGRKLVADPGGTLTWDGTPLWPVVEGPFPAVPKQGVLYLAQAAS